MGVYLIFSNESNNDYIAQTIKIEECCASELTIWEASGLAAGVLSRELLHGEDSHGGEASFSLGTAPVLFSLGSPRYFTMSSYSKLKQSLLITTSQHTFILAHPRTNFGVCDNTRAKES